MLQITVAIVTYRPPQIRPTLLPSYTREEAEDYRAYLLEMNPHGIESIELIDVEQIAVKSETQPTP